MSVAPPSPKTNDSPFFIVGASRSGTTLLRLILAGHSRLHIPPETWFLRPLFEQLPLTGPLTPGQVSEAVKIMVEHYRWPDMEIPAEDFARWVSALTGPRLVDIVNLVYRHHLDKAGKPRFGDKTPNYIDMVPEISEFYPDARFIHLIRDGRDVAISHIDADWVRYYKPHGFPWTRAIEKRREYRSSIYDSRIMDVRYEDLVSEPETTVRKICEFLGETFEPTMLEYRSRSNLVPERERGIHRKLDEPMARDAISVWQRKLRPWECFAIESCLYNDLLQLGYGLRFSSPGARPLLRATGWLLRASYPIMRRGVPYLQRRGLLPKVLYL